MPMAEARAAWTLVTRKKKRVQFQTYQSPKELAAKALAAAALAVPDVPITEGASCQGSGRSSPGVEGTRCQRIKR